MALKAPPYNMNGRYADIMATECSKHGMKPVCARSDRGDTQCRYDPAALYIGNSYDLTIPKYRTSGYTPCGFSAISYAFAGLCLYRNYSSDPRVYCNIPATSHQLHTVASSKNPGFMCGRRAGEEPYIPPKAGNTFSAKLGGADYTFRQAVLKRPQPNYYDRQVSTRILGRRTAPVPPFLIPNRVPHGFTQDPSTDRAHLAVVVGRHSCRGAGAVRVDTLEARPIHLAFRTAGAGRTTVD